MNFNHLSEEVRNIGQFRTVSAFVSSNIIFISFFFGREVWMLSLLTAVPVSDDKKKFVAYPFLTTKYSFNLIQVLADSRGWGLLAPGKRPPL